MNAKNILILGGVFLGSVLAARADPLDDLIAGLRSGAVTGVDPVRREEIVKAARLAASEPYNAGLAALYLWQIKASIVDDENHGGWPCRSFIVCDEYMRKALVKALLKQFDEAPDSITAYALLCPALYLKDEALFARAQQYLKDNDQFLSQRSQEQLASFWRGYITGRLAKEDAENKASEQTNK
jgi:hypothetical protein